ncbi:cytochrome P450 9e2-like [Lycorma delicatula]|uniref:cytochrome P450 9e2-like n=1 Tax=Lycorma delicatula TaxID=130591 RepID=UPI003F50EA6D
MDFLSNVETTDLIIIWYMLSLSVGILVYWYLTKPFSHWNIRGVHHIKPQVIFGNIKDRVLFKISFHEFQLKLYRQFKGHKFAGFYEGRRPVLIVLDPDIVKDVLVRDFDHFVDRPVLRFRASPYIENMILNLKGQHWKYVRTQMTPAFTSGKLKSMEILIRVCAKQMEEYLDNTVISKDNIKDGIDMKDFFGRFTMDVIASCAFGVQSNSLNEPDSEFIKIVSQFSNISILQRIALFTILLFIPNLSKFFPLSFFNMKSINFLGKVVIDAKHHRLKHSESRRNDFLQLMLDAESNESEKIKENGSSAIVSSLHNTEDCKITEDIVVAQSVLFLIAGFETSSTLLTFASYELALNPDIQDKLRDEILTILDKYDGECNYQALSEMNYLEMVLNEALRKHPPIGRTDRVCTKEYTIPGTNVTINPGESVCIPIMGFHYDPEYYPDPEKFDPERFSNESKSKRSPYVFLPFGVGPRNCIGLRFAMISTKSAMVHLLKKYKLTVCAKTEHPYTYSKFSMLLNPKNGIWLNVEKL